MRIVWTEAALRDLAALRAYIAVDNPAAAERQVRTLMSAVAALAEFPRIGRRGRRPNTRELVVNRTPYLVPYRIDGDDINVLRVLHGRQRWPDRL